MAKRDLSAAVKKAASQQPPTPVEDRFARAQQTIERRPTGYSASVVEQTESANTLDSETSQTIENLMKGEGVPVKAHLSPANSNVSATPILSQGLAARLGTPVFEDVPLDQIDDNPYNARHIYLPDRVAALAKSLRREGQLVPGLAARNNGRYTLIAAHYRKQAAIQEGFKTLKLMVYPEVSSQDLYLLSFKENEQHEPQSAIDNAIAWRKLLDDGVYPTENAIAQAVGISEAGVNKTLSSFQLDPSVREVIELAPSMYGISILYELVLLQKAGAPLEEVADCARKVPLGTISRRDLTDLRNRYEVPRTRRTKQNSRQYRITTEGQLGVIKEWDSGKVVLELTCTDPEERDRIVQGLRVQFGASQALPLEK